MMPGIPDTIKGNWMLQNVTLYFVYDIIFGVFDVVLRDEKAG